MYLCIFNSHFCGLNILQQEYACLNKELLWEWKFTNDDEDTADCVSINYNILARAPPKPSTAAFP